MDHRRPVHIGDRTAIRHIGQALVRIFGRDLTTVRIHILDHTTGLGHILDRIIGQDHIEVPLPVRYGMGVVMAVDMVGDTVAVVIKKCL